MSGSFSLISHAARTFRKPAPRILRVRAPQRRRRPLGSWTRTVPGQGSRAVLCQCAATWSIPFKPATLDLNDLLFNPRSRCTVEFQRTFRAGSRAPRCRQFLPFRNFNVTRQDVALVIKLEDVRRLRRASRVTLAFGILDDDAHGAASIVCAPARGVPRTSPGSNFRSRTHGRQR